MAYHSSILDQVVKSFSSMPGIGKRTALRLALYLVKQPEEEIERFLKGVEKIGEIKRCKVCFNLSDSEICSICTDRGRNHNLVCIVENIRDVIAIEETSQYRGVYHVLGGVISPIEGIGPEQLTIDPLVERVRRQDIKEVIMAISPTIEGETTIYYLSKRLQEFDINISEIARGVSFGGELQYADEITLGRSILLRTPYQSNDV